MRVIDAIQSGIRRLGYDIVRYRPAQVNPFDLLGLLIRDELVHGEVTVLQVGAADGVANDPLRASIVRHRLTGLLIEPLPDQFARLRAAYPGQPGLAFEQCAIAEQDGEATLYRIRADAPLPKSVQQLASFHRRNLTSAKQGVAGLDEHVEALLVPTRSIASLVAQYDLHNVTVLVVDAEGYDAEIVRMALNSIAPPVIMYEHVHLPPATQIATLHLLRARGYGWIEAAMDTYARRNAPPP